MQKIDRLPLGGETLAALQSLAERVKRAKDPATEAGRLWKGLSRGIRQEIQAVLIEMSTGRQRCMYCEDSQGTDIEHFRPKNEYPDHAFSWQNYLLACAHCNSNYKRTRFPLDDNGSPLLLDPSLDDPVVHLALSPTTGLFLGLDERGEVTIEICGLNRQVCVAGRRDAWTALECLITVYVNEKRSAQAKRCEKILQAIRRHPFQSVRVHMLNMLRDSPQPDLILPTEVIEAFAEFPELAMN